MSKDALEGWLVVLGIAFAVCALGWYKAANNSTVSTESSYGAEESSSDISMEEYVSALQDANDNIESANGCIDDVFDSFDSGYFEDGMSTLDECRRNTVSEPY